MNKFAGPLNKEESKIFSDILKDIVSDTAVDEGLTMSDSEGYHSQQSLGFHGQCPN